MGTKNTGRPAMDPSGRAQTGTDPDSADLRAAAYLMARFGDPAGAVALHHPNRHGCCVVCTVHGSKTVHHPCVIAHIGMEALAMQRDLWKVCLTVEDSNGNGANQAGRA